jgi:hypothetical protein
MIGKDFPTEPGLAPKNVSLLSLLSANDWQGFPTEPGLAPKNVSLLSLLSANDWPRFSSPTLLQKGVFRVSHVRNDWRKGF